MDELSWPCNGGLTDGEVTFAIHISNLASLRADLPFT